MAERVWRASLPGAMFGIAGPCLGVPLVAVGLALRSGPFGAGVLALMAAAAAVYGLRMPYELRMDGERLEIRSLWGRRDLYAGLVTSVEPSAWHAYLTGLAVRHALRHSRGRTPLPLTAGDVRSLARAIRAENPDVRIDLDR